MIVIDCEQGTPEWKQARLSVPSASSFSKIVQPANNEYWSCGNNTCRHRKESAAINCKKEGARGKATFISEPEFRDSASREQYMYQLIAESALGHELEDFKGAWMDRGNALEDEAADFYSLSTGSDLTKVGFCLEDGRRYGASPDRLINDDGGLEIKCLSEAEHLKCWVNKKVPDKYWTQVLGNLLVTNFEWWDFVSYHPELGMTPPIRTTAYNVLSELRNLEKSLLKFHQDMLDAKIKLINDGMTVNQAA